MPRLTLLIWAALLSIAYSEVLSWADIHWIQGSRDESQVQACSRFRLQALDMDTQSTAWNQSLFQHVVLDILNKSISPDANSYGISGCCAPGLWCNSTDCFTQNFADHFANYGPLPNVSVGFNPVYSCWNSSGADIPEVQVNGLSFSGSRLFLTGENFGDTNVGLNVPLNGNRCRNAGLCDCVRCDVPPHTCPVGSGCLNTFTTGFSCFPLCAGAGDAACPCGAVCKNVENVYGKDVSMCVPSNLSAVASCFQQGGSQLMCNAASVARTLPYSVPSALNVSLAVDYSGDIILDAPYTNTLRCSADADCIDGNICTLDRCVAGECVFVASPKCSSVLPTVMEQYTPYTYVPLSVAYEPSDVFGFISNSSTAQSLDSSDSSAEIKLPFSMLLFGGLLNQIKVYGNGIVAFPPYRPCSSVTCGVFSTASNLVVPWYSPNWSRLTYWTLAQDALSTTPLFGVQGVAFHVMMNATDSLNTSTFVTSLYPDGSVRFTYILLSNTPTDGDWAGLWGSTATEVTRTANYLRYGQEVATLDSLSQSESLAYCYLNTTACIPDSCAAAGTDLLINWNASSTCYATGSSAPLTHRCIWYGGVNATDVIVTTATASSQVTGKVICAVPLLDIPDGSVVPVDLVTVFQLPSGEVLSSSTGSADGNKAVYAVTAADAAASMEIARSNLMVRYYSVAATAEMQCGCSATSGNSSMTCDQQGVCAGTNRLGDCMRTPWGSAYHDACNDCVAGYTGLIPNFSCTQGPEGFLDIVSQTIILLVIICCMTVVTSTVSFSIRRMLLRRAQDDAIMMESEFAMQILQADNGLAGGGNSRRRGLSEFERDAIGQIAFTKAFWQHHKKIDRTGRGGGGEVSASDDEAVGPGPSSAGNACDCSICLNEVTEGAMVRVLPEPCGHVFHVDCIDQWFNQSSACPLCKRSVRSILIGDEESGAGSVGFAGSDSTNYSTAPTDQPGSLRGARSQHYNPGLRENSSLAVFGYRPRPTAYTAPPPAPGVVQQEYIAVASPSSSDGSISRFVEAAPRYNM